MSISIFGQNERWAQIQAYQPPPASQSGQSGGQLGGPGGAQGGAQGGAWDPSLGTSTSSGSTAIAGGTSATLSENTSFALIAFGGWGNGPATSTQTAGQSSTSSPSDASSPASATVGQTAITQNGTSAVSQLFTDLQSLLSALTGTPTSSASTPGTSDTTGTAANTGTVAATTLNSSVLQDLQTVASDLTAIASADGGRSPGRPPWASDISNSGTISNTGTTTGTTGGWSGGYSDGFQQQFALSVYSSSNLSGVDNSTTTSSLTSINV